MAKLTAEQLVQEAERNREGKPRNQGYIDDKYYVCVEDMLTLIDRGAAVVKANSSTGNLAYHTEVIYGGYRFMALTNEPIERLNI